MMSMVSHLTLRPFRRSITTLIIGSISVGATDSHGQQLTALQRAQIDSAAVVILNASGAPSGSIAIVRDGAIVYENAYGSGRINPNLPATPPMRYAIGSVSKQFTATAILLLEEDHKLSLDDKVAKWFPQLARANDVSIRQLLSMTSGYQDYWPQDYVPPFMEIPATIQTIMKGWATASLDFEPGTKYQYSNTNYVIAGAIVERVTGTPLMDFLQKKIFGPLKMTSVADFDASALSPNDAGGYLRNALGPLRPAPKEAKGWLFGAGHLAMTAYDLAIWDIAVMNHTVLSQNSLKTQQTEVILSSGKATGYGLGVDIGTPGGRRCISHGGAVSGFTSSNSIYPDDRSAIVVFTNIYPGATNAPQQLSNVIARIIFPPTETSVKALDLARRLYDSLAKGTIDRTVLTPSANAYFTGEVLSDFAGSLGPLGTPSDFSSVNESVRGGMTIRTYRIRAGSTSIRLSTMTLPDGQIDQYLISRGN